MNKKMNRVMINIGEFDLRKSCMKKVIEKYGNPVPGEIMNRLEWELESIERNSNQQVFYVVKELLSISNLELFEINSRGLITSSLVAFLMDLTEIDPIQYRLTPYSLYGLDGDFILSYDLNVPVKKCKMVRDNLSKIKGVEAAYFTSKFTGDNLNKKERFPYMKILVPEGINIADYTDLYETAEGTVFTDLDYIESKKIFPFQYVMNHKQLSLLSRLVEVTGVNPYEISLTDEGVIKLFSTRSWNEKDLPIGEIMMCYEYDADMIKEIFRTLQPKTLLEVANACALMHGTKVWDNQDDYVKRGIIDPMQIYATRDDISECLIKKGMEEKLAFRLSERIRKGMGVRDNDLVLLTEYGIDEVTLNIWKEIKYMFPRAHALSYVLVSWRLAYFKVYFGELFDSLLEEICAK